MTASLYTMFSYAKGHVLGLCHEKRSLTGEHLEKNMCCSNHVQLRPIILHPFQALKKIIAARMWWDGHLLYCDLRQQDDGQCWSQGRDYCHHPIYHMTLSPCFFWSTYGEDNLLTICMGDWARRLTRIKGENNEGQRSFWLHEDYFIAAQDQQLHIHQKWKEGQHDLSILISHFHAWSPYTIQMGGIGEFFL